MPNVTNLIWDEIKWLKIHCVFSRLATCNEKPESSCVLNTEVELLSEQGVDYTRLRELLAASQWKEADKETANVMLKAVGREKEGYLNIEDIKKFPCKDLRTIDQFWVKYSSGHFGFSVQKRIWEEVGGNSDYETFEKLGERVGWSKRGSWLNYSALTFSTQAPMGHLPFRRQRVRDLDFYVARVGGFFYSRVATCNL
ncbi:MAG: GUN4 domain-containing protein [Symploca sp. SIO2G7]|nr:GUN4 domain-containing protein [Symploca sp. SIO2G7]